jgi:hypothetical protein
VVTGVTRLEGEPRITPGVPLAGSGAGVPSLRIERRENVHFSMILASVSCGFPADSAVWLYGGCMDGVGGPYSAMNVDIPTIGACHCISVYDFPFFKKNIINRDKKRVRKNRERKNPKSAIQSIQSKKSLKYQQKIIV